MTFALFHCHVWGYFDGGERWTPVGPLRKARRQCVRCRRREVWLNMTQEWVLDPRYAS